jgi:hypothetical protein
MAERPRAHRCSICDVNWPTTTTYHGPGKSRTYTKCPLCGEDTWEAAQTTPLSGTEADALIVERVAAQTAKVKVEAEFEAFYVERERRRYDEWWASQDEARSC